MKSTTNAAARDAAIAAARHAAADLVLATRKGASAGILDFLRGKCREAEERVGQRA